MDFFSIIVIIAGLCLFETISSIDNAIINAEILSTMQAKARKWFLIWGLFFAVFAIRGLLPWLIVWATAPELGPIGAFTATFSNDPKIIESVEESSPILLIGGGNFLIFLFFHWLFLEPKNYGLWGERFFSSARGLVFCRGFYFVDNNCLARFARESNDGFWIGGWFDSFFYNPRV